MSVKFEFFRIEALNGNAFDGEHFFVMVESFLVAFRSSEKNEFGPVGGFLFVQSEEFGGRLNIFDGKLDFSLGNA